ncbi:cell wall-binding repeat-containing protein [Clostridium sp. PL3]|uniref:Cell wall-binding repeat-containing protein n=1 Tax=Clostridium thailandense TaxID=2794346 RepID=A0A949U143_9CLOT|nr:cell wall-binding repeat-containing protein [Clostridium thailandense]MBV7276443.1 cell wall-binding repeat-containing protein [Clostridium thailandense]
MRKKYIAVMVSILTSLNMILYSKVYAVEQKVVIMDTLSQQSNVTRITGTDCYDIGIKVSQKGWTTSDNVILAGSADFPDALSGTALGIKLNAPILFTDPNGIASNTLNEIVRLKAKKVYILGGTGAVSQAVEDSIKGQGLSVERLWGQDRFGTALAVGKKVQGLTGAKTAFIANAYNYPDALSSSTFAGQTGSPILLTDAGTLNEQSKQALRDWGITNVYVLGGTGVVSANIENELKDMGISLTRLGGLDRYETSQKIVKNFDSSLDKFTIVTGKDFHNALVASVYAEKIDHPLVLEDNDCSQTVKGLVKDKDLLIVGDFIVDSTTPTEPIVDEPGHSGNHIRQQILTGNLGFVDYDSNGSGLILNPYGANGDDKFTELGFTVGSGNRDMSLSIFRSSPEVDQKIKTILNMILPTQGDKLYSILDTAGLKTQTVELDGRIITIRVESYGLIVDFGPVK